MEYEFPGFYHVVVEFVPGGQGCEFGSGDVAYGTEEESPEDSVGS